MVTVAGLGVGGLNLYQHLDLAGVLELQRQRELLTGLQWLFHARQHHVVGAGLEGHFAMRSLPATA